MPRSILLSILACVLLVAGCRSGEPGPGPVKIITEDAILSVAEPAMRERYPRAYEAHKPYIAVPIPGTDTWRVLHFSALLPLGSPMAIVTDDGGILMMKLADVQDREDRMREVFE